MAAFSNNWDQHTMKQYPWNRTEMNEPMAASSVTAGHFLCPAGPNLKGQNKHKRQQRSKKGTCPVVENSWIISGHQKILETLEKLEWQKKKKPEMPSGIMNVWSGVQNEINESSLWWFLISHRSRITANSHRCLVY